MTTNTPSQTPDLRHDWRVEEVLDLYALPLADLMYQAQTLHRRYFDPNAVQLSSLLSIKTGACSEDCAYCSQSKRFDTAAPVEPLLDKTSVLQAARAAQAKGASRFCMGAAWRRPKERDFVQILELVAEVKQLGLETCMTLGMLDADQATRLQRAGLDYYNHNLDTSPEFYPEIVSTHRYEDRLETLAHVREAGLKVCAGGILGLGESLRDRAGLLAVLANLPQHPESVPINRLVKIPGTPLADSGELDPIELVRSVAVARILMPRSHVRLSAGRESMSDELQTLCFLAGANSIFYGERLLTTDNPAADRDQRLFERLGLRPC